MYVTLGMLILSLVMTTLANMPDAVQITALQFLDKPCDACHTEV